MATFKYRDPADGQFKEIPSGTPGPDGPPGPTGPAGALGESTPVGTILAYFHSVAPTGWHLCDGTAHGSAALEALTGSTLTPDLRDMFIAGTSATKPHGAAGGAATVTLTAAQSGLPGHTHTAAAEAHVHSCNPPSTASVTALTTHNHPMTNYQFAYTANNATKTSDSGDNNYHSITNYNTLTGATTVAHAHAVNIAAATSSTTAPAVTIAANAAANATAAHENLPPFYALAYIIRTV